MLPNFEQVKGIIERLALVGISWAAGAGYIPQDQVANIAAIVVAIFSVIWGWKVNTKPALEDAVKAVKKAEK